MKKLILIAIVAAGISSCSTTQGISEDTYQYYNDVLFVQYGGNNYYGHIQNDSISIPELGLKIHKDSIKIHN